MNSFASGFSYGALLNILEDAIVAGSNYRNLSLFTMLRILFLNKKDFRLNVLGSLVSILVEMRFKCCFFPYTSGLPI